MSVFNFILEHQFCNITIDPGAILNGHFAPKISLGLRFGNILPTEHLPGIACEILPSCFLNVECDFNKIQSLQKLKKDPLLPLPAVSLLIDLRQGEYIQQFYQVSKIMAVQSNHSPFTDVLPEYSPNFVSGRYQIYTPPSYYAPLTYQHYPYILIPHIHVGFTSDYVFLPLGHKDSIGLRPTVQVSLFHVPRHPSFGVYLDPQYHKFLTMYQNAETLSSNISIRPSIDFTLHNVQDVFEGGYFSLKFDFLTRNVPRIESIPPQYDPVKASEALAKKIIAEMFYHLDRGDFESARRVINF